MGSTAPPTHHERVAIELVRALRGRRSQNGFSRRVGYRSNVVHRWERGEFWPSAPRFLGVCEKLGIDVAGSYARMLQRRPAWLDEHAPSSAAAVAAFLRDLRGKMPVGQLAASAGINRFTVSRWLKGTATPNLPQLLRMVDAASHRLHDFVSTLIDPYRLPSIRDGWRKLELMRRLAYEEPWSHAVLRVLQLHTQRAGSDVATIASRLGLERATVRRLLHKLHEAGQVNKSSGRWKAEPLHRVDTSADRARARGLKAAWTRTALERLESGAPGLFGYSLFEVSSQDLERLRALQLEYARALQAIIADSEHTDCVGLYCIQLMDLASEPGNALAER